ncbi:MAG TPA: carbohydrate porin [Caulobacteraceae bacterium]
MAGVRLSVAGAGFAVALALATTAHTQTAPIADPTQAATQAAIQPSGKTPPPAPSPLTFSAAYTLDLLANVAGGLQQGGSAPDLLKLSVGYDGGLQGREGLSGLVSLEQTFGSSFTARDVGGLQDISLLEAPGAIRMYEAWVQQELFGGAAGVKAGFVDLNTTFDVQETAALFVNASHGTGPDLGDTGLNGPSIYPYTALAVTGFYRPADGWTAQLGVFDAVAQDPNHRGAFVAVKFDGALIIGQVERRFGDTARVEAGAWTYTSAFPALDQFRPNGTPQPVRGNAGAYGLVEGRLLSKGDEGQGLSGWVRLGLANGDINPVRDYLGAGLVWSGPMFGRDKDEAGVALARAGLSEGASEAGLMAGRTISGAETVLEATYRYVLKDWLSVQPDLQYVIRPHGDDRIPNALVVGVRFSATYSR